MAKVTLDSIRKSMEEKYQSFEIDLGDTVVSLLNPLRLTKEKRDKLIVATEKFSAEDSDMDPVAGVEGILDIVAESAEGAKRLKKEIDGDLPTLMEVLNSYLGEQKVGEASPSAN